MNKLQMKVLMEESVEALLRNVQNLTDAQMKMETEEWKFAEREQMMDRLHEMEEVLQPSCFTLITFGLDTYL